MSDILVKTEAFAIKGRKKDVDKVTLILKTVKNISQFQKRLFAKKKYLKDMQN